MRRPLYVLILAVIIISSVTYIAVSRGTLELTVERTPTPDQEAIATLASLMLNGTRYALQATQMAIPGLPTPELGLIQGKICYPSGRTPAMTAYFMNTTIRERFELSIYENQNTYSIQVPPGTYYAWAVAPQYQIGGYYSEYVHCGMTEGCADHSQLAFKVLVGETVTGIDICDWPHPIATESLPLQQMDR